jgi:hypothetical protein
MKEPYGKGDSDSILASSLASDTARRRLKRRQRYRWAGLLNFEKLVLDQDADSVLVEEGNTAATLIASGLSGPA